MNIATIDRHLIHFFRRISLPLARISIFVVYFWFGALKVLGLSPASGVVERLFESTIPFISFPAFLIGFGIFECIIGILFLIPRAERLIIPFLLLHLITTCGPLVMLPQETWTGFLVPTLEGQYIIKNILIAAVAIGIAAHLHPLHRK